MVAVKVFTFLLIGCFISSNSFAQYIQQDYLYKSKLDSNYTNKNRLVSTSKVITPKSLVLPGIFILYGFSARLSPEIRSIDFTIKREVWDNNPHSLVTIDNYLQYTPAATVYALNLFGIKGKNNLLDRTMIYVLTNSISELSVQSLKFISKIKRPDGSADNSFPSGHTATAFAAAEFLRQEYKDVSSWYGFAGYTVASLTGYLRIYNNRHWFSDVIEGAGIGILSTQFAYWLYPRIKQLFTKEGVSSTFILPELQNGTFCISYVTSF